MLPLIINFTEPVFKNAKNEKLFQIRNREMGNLDQEWLLVYTIMTLCILLVRWGE